tara:strand:- start:1183 stop:2211 length:1029 start_codon:yes stop_codon:yes gene_type:complete
MTVEVEAGCEIVTVEVKAAGSEWLVLRNNENDGGRGKNPDKTITFTAWKRLPHDVMMAPGQVTVLRSLAIPVGDERPPAQPLKLRAELVGEKTLTVRMNAPWLYTPDDEHGKRQWKVQCGRGLSVTQNRSTYNAYAGIECFGDLGQGCVQVLSVEALKALEAGEHEMKIHYSSDGGSTEHAKEPHAIVLVTVQPEQEMFKVIKESHCFSTERLNILDGEMGSKYVVCVVVGEEFPLRVHTSTQYGEWSSETTGGCVRLVVEPVDPDFKWMNMAVHATSVGKQEIELFQNVSKGVPPALVDADVIVEVNVVGSAEERDEFHAKHTPVEPKLQAKRKRGSEKDV